MTVDVPDDEQPIMRPLLNQDALDLAWRRLRNDAMRP